MTSKYDQLTLHGFAVGSKMFSGRRDRVNPVTALRDSNLKLLTNAQALISGWGLTSGGGSKANALQIANVTVWENSAGNWGSIADAAFPASVDGTVSSCQVSHFEFPDFEFTYL